VRFHPDQADVEINGTVTTNLAERRVRPLKVLEVSGQN